MMLKSVKDADFDDQVLASESAVLVDFWAEWCGPCKALAPTLDALARDYEGAVDIAKVNVDENTMARDRFGVRSIPTLALFKHGREVARLTGSQSRAKLGAFLDAHLAPEAQPVILAPEIPRATFCASNQTKKTAVAKLTQHIANGTCLPGPTMWDGTNGSPLGCAAELATAEEMSERLGLPPALIKAIDILSTYQGTTQRGCTFALAWLSALPVGTDLSSFPAELLLQILDGDEVQMAAASNEALKLFHDRLIAMHHEKASAEDWAQLREDLSGQTASMSNQFHRSIARCLQNAAWPDSDPDLLAQIIVDASLIAAAAVLEQMNWSTHDEAAASELLNKAAKQLVEDRGSARDALEEMTKADPDLAERYAAQAYARQHAMGLFGQSLCQSLIDRAARW